MQSRITIPLLRPACKHTEPLLMGVLSKERFRPSAITLSNRFNNCVMTPVSAKKKIERTAQTDLIEDDD